MGTTSVLCLGFFFFFFKQKTAYEITEGDWSSDVCSSDLAHARALSGEEPPLVDDALPLPDRGRHPHRSAADEQRGAGRLQGARGGPGRDPVAAHQLARRNAGAPDGGRGAPRAPHPADHRPRDGRGAGDRPAGRLVLRRIAHRSAGARGRCAVRRDPVGRRRRPRHRGRLVPAADRPFGGAVPACVGGARARHRGGQRLHERRRSPGRDPQGLERRGVGPTAPARAAPGRARQRPRGRTAGGAATGCARGQERHRAHARLRPRLLHPLRDPARAGTRLRRVPRAGVLLSVTALPLAVSANAVRDAVRRLAAIRSGSYRVVSCYLKLEPRDKTRGKYLIKMKNRIRAALAELERQALERTVRDQIAADLERIRRYFEQPAELPHARGIALFVCEPIRLFDVIPLPHVYRSRLAVEPVPLIRELLALEQEFGTILVAACDRTGARFFEVTAFDVTELPGLRAAASRTGKFHGQRQAKRGGVLAGGFGEHNYHMRIREEKHRHYAHVADHIYQIHTQRLLAGLVVAGIGVDAAALLPHLHTYLHDLVLGVVKLNPKKASAPVVREAALLLRDQRERAWEQAHAEAVKEGLGSGWAMNGIDPTLKALIRGQVRTLLADGHDDDPRIDDAVEEALHQRAQVDVLYDDAARRTVAGLAALLRFRR